MKDLHYDEDFIRDFRKASERWAWSGERKTFDGSPRDASQAHDETAYRLLEQVFGLSEAADDTSPGE